MSPLFVLPFRNSGTKRRMSGGGASLASSSSSLGEGGGGTNAWGLLSVPDSSLEESCQDVLIEAADILERTTRAIAMIESYQGCLTHIQKVQRPVPSCMSDSN